MNFNHTRRAPVLCALTTLLAACSGYSSPTGNNGSPLSTNEVTGVGSTIAAEIEASATAMSTTNASKSGGANADRVAALGSSQLSSASWTYTGCGVVTPSPAADADDDGIPDAATVTFALPACSFTSIRGKAHAEVTGSVDISDASAVAGNRGFDLTLHDLFYSFRNDVIDFGEKRNGSRHLRGDSTSIAVTNNIITRFDSSETTYATLVNTATMTFTPTTAGSIDMKAPLPAGTIGLSGHLIFSTDSLQDTFTMATVVPLAYDPACASGSTTPFEAGQLRATVTTNGHTGYLLITWSACAAATVEQFAN